MDFINKKAGSVEMVNSVGNVQLIQRINRVKVLEFIRGYGPCARTCIAENTNLSLSSITNIINYLLSCDLVSQSDPISSKNVGRRASLIEFNAAAMEIVAVNIEPDGAELALTDLDGKLISTRRIEIERFHDAQAVLAAVADGISELLKGAKRPCAIGIGINGHVRDMSGVVTSSVMRWKAVDVKSFFESRFDLHVYVTNNSKTKARWQLSRMGEGAADNMIFLDLTSGVGIISFYGGKINESVAGELGHTTVMKDGPLCFCGNRGCLELVCSVEYILQRCRKAFDDGLCSWISDPEKITFSQAVAAFEAGDAAVERIFRECAEYLGIGIANIISIFEPRTIVINSDKLTGCDFIYHTARREAEKRAYNMSTDTAFERVEITVAQALEGTARHVADCLFALSGPEQILCD